MEFSYILWLILLTCTHTRTIQAREGPPVILSQSNSTIYSLIYTPIINLSCTADGSLPLTFLWEHNYVFVQNITVYNFFSNLTLKNSDDWIEGTYTCIVENQYGRVSSDNMDIIYMYPSTITPIDEIQQPPLNMPHTLRCDHLPGELEPEVEWFKTDTTGNTPRRVQYNQRITADTTGSLHFLYLDRSDEGRYHCDISFPSLQYHQTGHTIHLTPLDIGIQISTESHVWNSNQFPTAMRGQSLTLRCLFGGNPIPKIRWYKIMNNGTFLPALSQNIEEYGRSLTFQYVNFEDAGEYECSTDTGTVEIQFYVTVESSPVWIETPKPIVTAAVPPSDTFQFFCGAEGTSTPVISWYINTEPVVGHHDSYAVSNISYTDTMDTVRSMLSVYSTVSLSVKCVCDNYHGSISSYSYLYIAGSVTHPPSFIPTINPNYTPSSTPRLTSTPAPTSASTSASTFASTSDSTSTSTTTPTMIPAPESTPRPTPGSTPRPTPGSTPLPTTKQSLTPVSDKVSDGPNTAIIGGAVGAVVAIVIVIVVVYCVWSKRRNNLDSVPKSDARMGYGNKGYNDVEMRRVQKPDNGMVHQNKIIQKGEKGDTYTGLTQERDNKKGNVYEELGVSKTQDNVANKPEETEYCYISDSDFLRAQRQKPTPTDTTGDANKEVANTIKTDTPVTKDQPQTSGTDSTSKPLPKVPTTQNSSYGKMGRFSSGKYSAIGNPGYSSQVLTQPKQFSAPQSYEEPIRTTLSTPTTNQKPVVTQPDDGYFKLEATHVKM